LNVTNNVTNSNNPLVFEVSNLSNEVLSIYTETSLKRNVPVVVYSMNPVKTQLVEHTETSCSLNLETGEFKEENTSSYFEEIERYEYHVITAGNPSKHKSFSYYASNGNSTYFTNALQEEIILLEEASAVDNHGPVILSSFSGDDRAVDRIWYEDEYHTGVISALDDGDGWSWKQRYQHEVRRSVYDYNTGWKWWTIDEGVTSYSDSGDYKEDYANWVGPWIYERENCIYNFDGTEWDHYPTSTVGTWTQSFSQSIKIGSSGPTVGFGASQSSGGSMVKITDNSVSDELLWNEEFPPESGYGVPNYFGFPWWMDPPITASHTNFKSYRASLFHNGATSSFNFRWDLITRIHWDGGFFFFGLLFFTRHSLAILDSGYSPHPAS